MLSLASRKQGWIIFMLWNISRSRTCVLFNKTTKSMNLLGGMGLEWWFLVEWLHKARGLVNLVYLTCGWPPRNKEIWDVKCWEASSAATWPYGLFLDHIGCNNLAIWTVGGSGMIGWNASIWSKGRLLKDLVSMHVESCGEVHHLSRE